MRGLGEEGFFQEIEFGFAAGVHGAEAGFYEAAAAGDGGGGFEVEAFGGAVGEGLGCVGAFEKGEIFGVKLDPAFAGFVGLIEGFADGGGDGVGGDGEFGDQFLGDFEGEGDEGGFAILDGGGEGVVEGLEDAVLELDEFGALLEELFAEGLFAGELAAEEGGLFEFGEARGVEAGVREAKAAERAGEAEGFRRRLVHGSFCRRRFRFRPRFRGGGRLR